MSNAATASLRGKAQASGRSANPHLRIYRHCECSEAIHNLQNLEMLRDNTESSSIIPPPLAEGLGGGLNPYGQIHATKPLTCFTMTTQPTKDNL
ncbi:hypothetical protein [uncultured Helicobacter sp.]|uniref:hypothetical protein n=1 Tax=uncultured Helicobacter sp. TaxID=175537 RepID=UPI0025FCFEFA|nr:hypothetical protein [uncultured Helicobacter sp.]